MINTIENLQELVTQGITDFREYGSVKSIIEGDLIAFNYNNRFIKDEWNYFETISRGLILNRTTGEIVSRPFEKFFNYTPEKHSGLIIGDITEKLDGSLIIISMYKGKLLVTTRGGFNTDVAIFAQLWLEDHGITGVPEGKTFLFECIYPDNRVVVNYGGKEELILIGIIENNTNTNLYRAELPYYAKQLGVSVVQEFDGKPLDWYLSQLKVLDMNHEGWVIRYMDDHKHHNIRAKLKGEQYLAAHRVLSNLTDARILNLLTSGNYYTLTENLPAEATVELQLKVSRLETAVNLLKSTIKAAVAKAPKTSRKDFALWAQVNCPKLLPYMFAELDGKDYTTKLLREIRDERYAW